MVLTVSMFATQLQVNELIVERPRTLYQNSVHFNVFNLDEYTVAWCVIVTVLGVVSKAFLA